MITPSFSNKNLSWRVTASLFFLAVENFKEKNIPWVDETTCTPLSQAPDAIENRFANHHAFASGKGRRNQNERELVILAWPWQHGPAKLIVKSDGGKMDLAGKSTNIVDTSVCTEG